MSFRTSAIAVAILILLTATVFAQRPPRSGDYAFVRTEEMSTFKQVFFEAGQVRLVPLNRSYEEARVPTREIIQMWKLVQHVRLFE